MKLKGKGKRGEERESYSKAAGEGVALKD